MLYCHKIYMSDFINSILGENVMPNWDQVFNEYIGLRENKGSQFILTLLKEITYLKVKQYIIFKCVSVCSGIGVNGFYSRDLILELKKCGCSGTFDFSNKEKYSAELRAAYTYGKKFTTQINRKTKEIEDYNKKHSGEKLKRFDFDITALELETHFKIGISFDKIFVSRWCSMLNEYERYAEIVNAQQNNLLNKKSNGRRQDR